MQLVVHPRVGLLLARRASLATGRIGAPTLSLAARGGNYVNIGGVWHCSNLARNRFTELQQALVAADALHKSVSQRRVEKRLG